MALPKALRFVVVDAHDDGAPELEIVARNAEDAALQYVANIDDPTYPYGIRVTAKNDGFVRYFDVRQTVSAVER